MASLASSVAGQKCAFVQAPRVCTVRPVSVQVVNAVQDKRERRTVKHYRIRRKVSGTEERPRLAVFRSNNHMYAQVIDDVAGNTLVAASTLTKEIRSELGDSSGGNVNAAQLVGKAIAEKCAAAGISKVAFDRAGYKYHGRVMAVADAAREGGLDF